MPKRCFREPIPEIYDSARYLDAAVSAHLNGYTKLAEELFNLANNPVVWEWTDSIWGKASKYVVINKNPKLHTAEKEKVRMPNKAQMEELRARDGYHCRFCGMPVIRAEVRKYFKEIYPEAVGWERTNKSQHAAFQCMWLQYDHVVPHSSGGTNDLDNVVITCAACNYGKWNYTLEELDLYDPRDFPPVGSTWDGLERVFES
ncbi:HNH endonuclease [Zhongshania guokunii]|uniref:HNH endonuclease n=1 Tax=Zhongshania guokunii TaxID=641783 RepID=A0ABV3U4E6_9GAMM